MSSASKYKELGVDPRKSNVRKIFTKYIANDYPDAFVNIVTDPENPDNVFTMHMDGDGSKIVQRVLHYLETGDVTIFQGAVDDAISMNTGDIAASGFITGKWVVTDVININAMNIPKNIIMEQVAKRFSELINIYKENGFDMFYFLGGETADLPTQISSMVFDVGIYARTEKKNIVAGNVKPGDKIYGFASNGRASWENIDNSGMMSNGVTLARIDLMHKKYAEKYPFLNNKECAYRGKYKINDKPKMLNGMTVSEAILSPTRQWAIVIKRIIKKLKEKNKLSLLHGISMNTGGGATKIGHVGSGILYRKTMPKVPLIFKLIKEESEDSWRNMFETFNCGVGIDVVGENNPEFSKILKEVSEEIHVEMFDLGVCEQFKRKKNKIELETPYGFFNNY
ncbi:hypothetical protein KAJ61_01425 [Candidatus Parcubacteria bacterium]|nr:hypothetical protein [Candidatus Parcubacteria bacterium]